MRYSWPILALTLGRSPPFSQAPSITLSGEIRLRGEWDGRAAQAGDDAATGAPSRHSSTSLSGDADTLDATRRAFATLYPTGHGYHGYMDYFVAFPGQTRQAGLLDAMGRIMAPVPQPWSLRADVHYFAVPEERNGAHGLGVEADVVVGRTLVPGAGVEVGASMFAPQDLIGTMLPAFALGTDDPTYWVYVMLTVRFP